MCAEKPSEMPKCARDVMDQHAPIISASVTFVILVSTILSNQNLHRAKPRPLDQKVMINRRLASVICVAQEFVFSVQFVAMQCVKNIVISLIKISVNDVIQVNRFMIVMVK